MPLWYLFKLCVRQESLCGFFFDEFELFSMKKIEASREIHGQDISLESHTTIENYYIEEAFFVS